MKRRKKKYTNLCSIANFCFECCSLRMFQDKINSQIDFVSIFEVMITVLHNKRSNVNQKFCAKSLSE